MLHRSLFSTLLIVATVTASGWGRETADILPPADQVKSAVIQFDHPQLDDVQFKATAADWTAIRKTLLPAIRDDMPASWEWVGTARLVRKDGSAYRVELYSTSKIPGAFAAGTTYKSRIYYRGGKSAELMKALLTAFDKSATRQVDPQLLRRLLSRADKLEIKVAKDSGGFYDVVTVLDDKQQDGIEPLAKQLKFVGQAVPRAAGNLGTTTAADLTAYRRGKKLGTLQLRGQEIWFGADYAYMAKLADGNFYRQLRALVGDPLPE